MEGGELCHCADVLLRTMPLKLAPCSQEITKSNIKSLHTVMNIRKFMLLYYNVCTRFYNVVKVIIITLISQGCMYDN